MFPQPDPRDRDEVAFAKDRLTETYGSIVLVVALIVAALSIPVAFFLSWWP